MTRRMTKAWSIVRQNYAGILDLFLLHTCYAFYGMGKSTDDTWFGFGCVIAAFISRLHQSSHVNMVNVNMFIRIFIPL